VAAEPLAVYLDDHLAGSVAALTLMHELAELHRGQPLETTLRRIHAEVSEEQQGLRELFARVGGSPSAVKQAAAWLSEKVGEGKLALAARSHPALATLQGLESLVLGLRGKLALYEVLERLAPEDARLQGDFAGLAARTVAQHDAIDAERLLAAAKAFGRSG
jgi:hypothetical protein